MQHSADTPCIGVCSTAIGDDVCQGCARTFEEISFWYELEAGQKARVWDALPRRRVWQALAKVAGGHLCIDTAGTDEQAQLQLVDGRLLHLALPFQDAHGRWVPLQLNAARLNLLVSDTGWPQALRDFLRQGVHPAG